MQSQPAVPTESAARPTLGVQELEALVEATRAIAEVLDLELVLQLIVDRVRVLVGAEYAALSIVHPNGGIERFITSGMDADLRHTIAVPDHFFEGCRRIGLMRI